MVAEVRSELIAILSLLEKIEKENLPKRRKPIVIPHFPYNCSLSSPTQPGILKPLDN
jgi:hypothetical protein